MNHCPVSYSASNVPPTEQIKLVRLAVELGRSLTIRDAGASLSPQYLEQLATIALQKPGLIRFEF